MDRETFIDTEAKPIATRRLERSLVLEELAQKEEIRLKEGELENAVVQRMMELQQTPGFDPDQYKTKTSQRELTNAVAYDTANMLLNQHLFARLKEIARGELEAAEKAAAEAPAKESQPEPTEEPQAAVEVDEPVESEASAPQAEPANEEETPAAETPEKTENE
jgi:FKBP-type peptidyl-prolyl cis-trans isomerase (trigger factor)